MRALGAYEPEMDDCAPLMLDGAKHADRTSK